MSDTSAIRIGKAGEYRVMAELIIRGYSPALVAVDDGTDIVLSDGTQIGVKTSLKSHYDSASYSERYKINLNPHQLRYEKGRPARVNRPRDCKVVFFIVWLVDIDTFYIIPVDAIRGVGMINIMGITPPHKRKYKIKSRSSESRFAQYKDAWHLLEEHVRP